MPSTVQEFRASVAEHAPPAGLHPPLEALWWAAKGEWDRAHRIVADGQGAQPCDLVHAHLHRQEGDQASAVSWYHDAGETPSELPLQEEWEALVRRFLPRGGR